MEDTSEANPLLTLAVLEDALSVPELRPGALQLFEALAMRATAQKYRNTFAIKLLHKAYNQHQGAHPTPAHAQCRTAHRLSARPVRACSLPSGTFLARVHAASAGAGKSWDILQPSYTFKRRKDISSATVVAHLVSAIDATSGDSVSVVLNSELCASGGPWYLGAAACIQL